MMELFHDGVSVLAFWCALKHARAQRCGSRGRGIATLARSDTLTRIDSTAVPDVAPPIFFNSGFMVLQPALDTFNDLQVAGPSPSK